jgi:hypothetical protein
MSVLDWEWRFHCFLLPPRLTSTVRKINAMDERTNTREVSVGMFSMNGIGGTEKRERVCERGSTHLLDCTHPNYRSTVANINQFKTVLANHGKLISSSVIVRRIKKILCGRIWHVKLTSKTTIYTSIASDRMIATERTIGPSEGWK